MIKRRPLILGITGNIGTGKSTVSRMLGELGAELIDADQVAHTVMRPGTPVNAQIVRAFGPQGARPDGEIDRKRLAAIVFADPGALAQLEAIVHPATVDAIGRRIAAACAEVVVVEAIKLIEAGLADLCHTIWVTTCREDQQLGRAADRGMTRDGAERRIRSQSPQDEKTDRADAVIDNSGSLARTRAQVRAAWNRFIAAERGPTA